MTQFSKKIFLITAFLFFVGGVAFAKDRKEIKLFVGPAVFDIEIEKGETYDGKILLWNKNDVKLRVSSQLVSFDARDELGGISYSEREGAKWFSNKESKIILEPRERKIINFKIKIPENTPRGGYYISWLFTPEIKREESDAKLVPRVSSLFLISVGKKNKANFKIIESEIPTGARYSFLEKFFGKDFILNSARFPFNFRVKNNDIYHTRVQGTLEVLGGEESIGKINVKETTIFPKKIRKVSVNFKPSSNFISNFYFGKYRVILTMKASGFTQKIEKEVFILPWQGTLFIKSLLLLVLLYFIITKQKKRVKKKIPKNKSRARSRTKNQKNKRTLTSKSKLR